jgi:hypothetical protein
MGVDGGNGFNGGMDDLFYPRFIHFLPNSTTFNEITLFPLYQTSQQHITQMNQRDGYIGNGLL